jgi:predicted nucleic acid-binding Zn ribbon protein
MVRAPELLQAALAPAVRQAPLTPEKVEFAWRAAGGAAIARTTRVALGEDRVLRVTGDDPQWLDAVHGMRSHLLRQLEPWLGAGTVALIEVIGGTAPKARRLGRRANRAGA